MTFGKSKLRTDLRAQMRSRLPWAAALWLTGAAAPGWAFGLTELMTQLAQQRSGQARYTEQRFVSGFEQSLFSNGTLTFQAPDKLARTTLAPRAESFVVDGNRLSLERSGRTRHLQLDAMPELAAMVAAMRGTLMGDALALQQHFKITVKGTTAQWSLTLRPLDNRLLGVVRQVHIEGQRSELRSVEVSLSDGDRSVMTIEAIAQDTGKTKGPTP